MHATEQDPLSASQVHKSPDGRILRPCCALHLAASEGSPVTLKRYPDCVTAEAYWEKDAPSFTPELVRTFLVPWHTYRGVPFIPHRGRSTARRLTNTRLAMRIRGSLAIAIRTLPIPLCRACFHDADFEPMRIRRTHRVKVLQYRSLSRHS